MEDNFDEGPRNPVQTNNKSVRRTIEIRPRKQKVKSLENSMNEKFDDNKRNCKSEGEDVALLDISNNCGETMENRKKCLKYKLPPSEDYGCMPPKMGRLQIPEYTELMPNCLQFNYSPSTKDLFVELIEIFPDIDPHFLRGYCQQGLNFYEITDLILNLNGSYPKNINGQFNFLMELLPNADPDFLRRICKERENDLFKFASEALEHNDYPKKTIAKLEKCEAKELCNLKLYRQNFNIGSFLKIFPDPFHYFMDKNRVGHYSDHAYEFLKGRYLRQSIKIIKRKYSEFQFNLTRTCEALDTEPWTRSSKRGLHEILMPESYNLQFFQEVCFIEHKKEIKEFMKAKQDAYNQAEKQGTLIECGCCYQQIMFEDCATCNEGDLFCTPCIQQSVQIRIGDGCTNFPCLLDCGSQFSFDLLKTLLDTHTFSKLLKRAQLDEVMAANVEGLEICPFCEFATVPPSDTNIFTCLYPKCSKESCRKCHKENHIPKRCEEVDNDDQERARKYIEDELTKALVRECYSCHKSYIKSDGCNKMTCTCGAMMCYICRTPVVNYKHFYGAGAEPVKDKCPLFSSDKVLHVDAIKAIGENALQVVTASNPQLKLDQDLTVLLPSEPKASTYLPAGVNEEPEIIVANLQRIHNQAAPQHPNM